MASTSSSTPTPVVATAELFLASSSSSSSVATAAPPTVEPAPPVITLAGKVAIVTGSSRGIGAGIALRLARDGAKVIVNYNSDSKAGAAVVAAIVKGGSQATAVQADVTTSQGVDKLFSEAKRLYGRVDIVVANAGVASSGLIARVTNDEFDRVMAVNLKGVFYALRSAANLVENNGRIVVIGSILRGGLTPGMGAYAATKSAIETLATTLAQEVGRKGITVNTIHPGAIDTDMLAELTPKGRKGMERMSPFRRMGTVADVGDSVALICSESARWISGQAIYVTGASKL